MEWFGEVLLKTIGLGVFGMFFTAASCSNTGIEIKELRFRNGFILCLLLSVVSTAYSKQ
jgi:hypothetical protein